MLAQKQVAHYALNGIMVMMLLFCAGLIWRSFTPDLMSKKDLQINGAMLLHTPAPVVDFQLVDHLNQPFSLDRLKGIWSIIFFAFTNKFGLPS